MNGSDTVRLYGDSCVNKESCTFESGTLPKVLLLIAVGLEFFLYPRFRTMGAYVRLVDIALVVSLAVFLWRLASAGSSGLVGFLGQNRRLVAALFLVAAMGLISLPLSLDHRTSFKELIQLFEHLFLVIFTVWALGGDRSSIWRVGVVLIAMCLFESVYGMVQYVLALGMVYITNFVRITGTLGNYLSTYLLVGIIVSLTHAVFRPNPGWKRYSVSAAFILSAALLVQVRSVWALIVLGILLVGVLARSRKGIFRLAVTLALGLAMFFSVIGAQKVYKYYYPEKKVVKKSEGKKQPGQRRKGDVSSRKPGSGKQEFFKALSRRGFSTLDIRMELWGAAIKMFKDRPLTGVGLGNFGKLYLEEPYTTDELQRYSKLYWLSKEIDAHSCFFTRLAETGLLGSVLYIVFLFTILGWAYSLARSPGAEAMGLAVALLVFVSIIADLVSDPPGNKLFWIFVGMLWVMVRDAGLRSDTFRAASQGCNPLG